MLYTGRKLLPFLFGIIGCVYGLELVAHNQITCSHGCGSSSDPDVIRIGDELVKGLERINFLEKTCSTLASDGDCSVVYEGNFGGRSWNLSYSAEYSYELDDYDDNYDDDDDENGAKFAENYSFYRERSSSSKVYNAGSCTNRSGTSLNNFLETSSFINCIFDDISFAADHCHHENWRCCINHPSDDPCKKSCE